MQTVTNLDIYYQLSIHCEHRKIITENQKVKVSSYLASAQLQYIHHKAILSMTILLDHLYLISRIINTVPMSRIFKIWVSFKAKISLNHLHLHLHLHAPKS